MTTVNSKNGTAKNNFAKFYVIRSFFSAFIVGHKFFVEKSPSYVGRMNVKSDRYIMSWKEKIYYPIAYCKFQRYTIIDWWNGRKRNF